MVVSEEARLTARLRFDVLKDLVDGDRQTLRMDVLGQRFGCTPTAAARYLKRLAKNGVVEDVAVNRQGGGHAYLPGSPRNVRILKFDPPLADLQDHEYRLAKPKPRESVLDEARRIFAADNQANDVIRELVQKLTHQCRPCSIPHLTPEIEAELEHLRQWQARIKQAADA